LAATLDYLMGKFNGGRTAADGCRDQPLLAVILQEGNDPGVQAWPGFGRRLQPRVSQRSAH
jgi:hypothetical protein